MPRRALRKVDPSLDLSRWLRTFEKLPQPWNAEVLFNRTAPLEVEVGSGKGLFIASASAARPDHNFLGIEIAHKYAKHAAAKLARQGRTNAVMVHGDGLRIFRELLPDSSLAAVHVYFPDPWWKARHKKRRVMNEAFLRDVERVLQPGGVLHFWTDVEEYFQTTLELIRAATHLAGPFEAPEQAPQHDLDYRTHFERRMRLNGEPVYRAEFRRMALPLGIYG
ncbi:MAG TPA: tRNA (guanosine(46)-N7)-methyltransferase TrmB [Pirellulales bacterium]|nr:tRNA (guanosine(46)-N7)-methyltransferase TrmB [Pirellulales bacterium]